MKEKKETTFIKSKKGLRYARNVFVGLAALAAGAAFCALLVGNAIAGEEWEERSGEVQAILKQVDSKQDYADKVILQAQEDLAADKISQHDYFLIYQQMQYVKQELPESTYIETYAPEPLREEYKAIRQECYAPAAASYNAAKGSAIAAGASFVMAAGLSLGVPATKKRKQESQGFLDEID